MGRLRPEFEAVLVRDFLLPLSQMFLIKWLGVFSTDAPPTENSSKISIKTSQALQVSIQEMNTEIPPLSHCNQDKFYNRADFNQKSG